MDHDENHPPKAKVIPYKLNLFGDERIDNYYWMRLSDKQKTAEYPDYQTRSVLAYLYMENGYRECETFHSKSLEDSLYDEIVARIKQTDMSVPYSFQKYLYYTRYDEGKEFPIYCRKKLKNDAEEEVLMNVNEMAEGFQYYHVGSRSVSPNNCFLAFGEDTVSRRQFTIRIKNLCTGELFEDKIENTTGKAIWGNDNKTIFYTKKDEALRSFQIYKHILGTPAESDALVYHEPDGLYSTFIYKSRSEKYLIIGSSSTLSDEYRILEADQPDGEFRVFQPRMKGLEYSISHHEGKWYVKTNKDGVTNFKVMVTDEHQTEAEYWEDFIVPEASVFIEHLDVFKDFMVVSLRKGGLTQLKIVPWGENEAHEIVFDEATFTVSMGINLEYDTESIRIEYTSMTTPLSTFDYNVNDRSFTLLKRQEVVGEFNIENYHAERVMVKADDGVLIPMSIVYKKGFQKNGTHPVLLYGYGAYGYSMDAFFSSARLSLLDRGFAFAIAHVRGGQEMGRPWYEDGKFFNKKNTFTDFIACGQYLVDAQYAAPDKLFAQGGSAGGLLIGAVLNINADLWKAVIAHVPFVDVLSTMLDESIPLTIGEFDEWGNPKDEAYYQYIKSYSPYDNITAKNYPAMFITTGYWDSQVQYWEPAKYVAKLRATKTDDNPIYLYCSMETGHGGASGRFKRLREVAMDYAFLLDQAGLRK